MFLAGSATLPLNGIVVRYRVSLADLVDLTFLPLFPDEVIDLLALFCAFKVLDDPSATIPRRKRQIARQIKILLKVTETLTIATGNISASHFKQPRKERETNSVLHYQSVDVA